MPPLSILIKPASGSCNMTCSYCFYCDEMKNRSQSAYGMMSEETLKNVIRKTLLQAEGSISYAFQGGEPTLRGLDFFRTLMEYEKKYNRKGIPVHNAFQTNGLALNEEWCRFFHDNHFLIGVSLDGTQEIHDSFRRCAADHSPTYQKIRENIALLEQYQVDYNILTVITAPVARNIKTIYRNYKAEGFAYQQYIECLDPLYEEKGSRPYSLTPELYGDFLVDLFQLWYQDWKKGTQPYIRKFENYVGILLGYPPESCEQRGICGIQTVVEADGSAYPCDFFMMDEYRLGNFNECRLPDMDQKRLEIGFVERSSHHSAACRSCEYYSLCRSGCQRSKITSPEGEVISYFCSAYKKFFRNCLPQLQEVADFCRTSAR